MSRVLRWLAAGHSPPSSVSLPGPTPTSSGRWPPSSTDWATYGGDLASRRYRPFDQINRDNFKDLEVAWRYKTDALGPRPEFNFEVTPLMVNGVLYTTAGTRRAVVALDAATGEMLWMHREDEGKARREAAPRRLLRTRPRVLDRWTREPDRLRHAWLPDGGAGCPDRPARAWIRDQGHRRSQAQ